MKTPRRPLQLPSFTLADQFGTTVDAKTYAGSPVIIVAGNREGAKGVALWTAALRKVIGDERDVHVIPIADLKGVPKMLRKAVSRMLPRDPAHCCAIDWNGDVGPVIRGDGGPLVAASFGPTSQLMHWASLPLDTVESDVLVALVEAAHGWS